MFCEYTISKIVGGSQFVRCHKVHKTLQLVLSHTTNRAEEFSSLKFIENEHGEE